MPLSATEIDYISKGVQSNLRADGRQRTSLRPFTLETGLITQSSGSSRCVAGSDVLVCIKAEVGYYLENEEQEDASVGKIVCNVQWYLNSV